MTTAVRLPTEQARDATAIRVLLAIHDFPILAIGLRRVIAREPGLLVVADSTCPDATAAEIASSEADVVITECAPTAGSGCGTFEAIEQLRAACPATRIIALDCRSMPEQFSLALRAGANGFLTREALESDVVAAIRGVMAGHTYVSPSIVTRMVDTYVRRATDSPIEDAYESLNEREREVLLLAALGHTTREIARVLHVSEQTAHYVRATVMEKLDLHDRVDLLRYSVRRGLVDPSSL